MELTNFFSLLGGLALFLYGMNMMSNGLEEAAGDRMKTILEKLTTNRFLGIGVGALITAVIQSSSATTVMVVGFVNAGLMNLSNAVWVIMGANVGTTITGQLIALNITEFAPVIAFIGVALIAFVKNKKTDAIGQVIAGLGILFMGMEMMSSAMVPLRDSEVFVNMVSTFENPLIGIIVGALFTAVIQSSSASVGVMQALAVGGVIGLPQAVYVLFGQNIGTCITSVLASIGANRNAKRATVIHLSFNIIGTVIFVILSMITPFVSIMESLTPNVSAQIANVHTVFNITTTLLLLPIGKQLVKLSYLILPERKGEDGQMDTEYLDESIFTSEYRLGIGTIANTQLFNETQNMLNVALDNVRKSFELIADFKEEKYEKLLKNEEYINYLNKEIVDYTALAISSDIPQDSVGGIALFMRCAGDLERIGDHAVNIAQRAELLYKEDRHFSKEALNEISIMNSLCTNILEELKIINYVDFKHIIDKVDVIEESIDKTYNEFSVNQLIRLKNKECTTENSVVFTKILTDYERIGDHGLNIAESIYKIREVRAAMKMVEAQEMG
ncbi:MAG: Na/Pi cotransporter family protein [Erysipelotrichaceae bacterium]|nr:Na/Pi cotransporter family protein [Erysipelotrichaceae bacterium]